MLHFLLHDAETFERSIAPALAASWRRHSFGPLVGLAEELGPAISTFAERFHLTADEQPLVLRLSEAQPFDRRLWRHLAGEVLLYAAADAPAIQTAFETLTALVRVDERDVIHRAHAGSRGVAFDGVPYRPGNAGMNDVADVARLADGLIRIDPLGWKPADLAAANADEPAEELAFAADCLAALRELYSQASRQRHVVVCEEI
jgi:hypothetical protein